MTDQASRLTRLPLSPLADNSVSAVLPVCRASAEFSKKLAPEVDELVVDDADELDDELVEPDEPPVPEELDVPDEPDVVDEPDAVEEPEEGAVGWKKVLPTPNPKLPALVPPIVIKAVSFWPLMVS
ncbi:MAG: hypothetical protein WBW06_12620 [Xanthobacteraceae bacterium]